MSAVKVAVDGKEIPAEAGEAILSTCEENGIHIRTPCSGEHLRPLDCCWAAACGGSWRLEIDDGEKVKVISRRGEVIAKAKVTNQ